jgi:hypothetical protein
MRQAFRIHARGEIKLSENVRRHLLENAGANARQNVFLCLALDDRRVDPRPMQEMAEHQTRRSGTDNRYIGHCKEFLLLIPSV